MTIHFFSHKFGPPHQFPQTLEVFFGNISAPTGWVVVVVFRCWGVTQKESHVKPQHHSCEMSSQQKKWHHTTKKSLGILKWNLGRLFTNFEVFTKLPSENKKILKFQVCWFETLGGFQVTPLFIAPYDGSRESKPSLPFKLLSAMKALVFGFSTFNTGRLQR